MYTSAQYKNDPEGNSLNIIEAVKDGVTWWVPIDTSNRDYTGIMRQVEAGELTVEPADTE